MIKALVGYTLVDGITPAEYDEWLYKIHTPDLLANPHIEKIVYNTVLRPVIDRIFPFEQAADAVRYMESGEKIGKIVIKVT